VFRVNSNSSAYPAYVGGNYNDNANYGFFYVNANNSATNTNSNLGSRLRFLCFEMPGFRAPRRKSDIKGRV